MCATLLTGETACPFTEEAYTSSIPPTEREGYCYSLLRRCFTCPAISASKTSVFFFLPSAV